MNIKLVKDEYDDHSGMTADDLEEAKEWEQRLSCIFSLNFLIEKNFFKSNIRWLDVYWHRGSQLKWQRKWKKLKKKFKRNLGNNLRI